MNKLSDCPIIKEALNNDFVGSLIIVLIGIALAYGLSLIGVPTL